MTVNNEGLPEQSGQSDHTPSANVPDGGNGDAQLILPNVPTQSDLEIQLAETNRRIAEEQQGGGTGVDADAPWGRKADGTPRAKPGRPSKSANTDRLNSVTPARELPSATNSAGSTARPARPTVPNQTMPTADYVAMGQLAANLWFNAGEIAFGEDWQPDPNEPALIAGAFRNYFQAKEIKVMSPELVLVVTLGMYAMARVKKPTVQSRIGKVVEWAKNLKFRR